MSGSGPAGPEVMQLLDWRRRIRDLYAAVRAETDPRRAFRLWCETRRELFGSHPQSPLPEDRRSAIPRYYPYDPALRTTARVSPASPVEIALPGSGGQGFPARRFGVAGFELLGQACELSLFWLLDYAGGLLVAFRDATTGTETYGGGRYLLDTAKGADLGGGMEALRLDFNLAYQPSCAYDPRWSCPLPPPGSTLPLAIRAGERL